MKTKIYFTKNQFMILDGQEMICHAGQYYDFENKDARFLIEHQIGIEVKNDIDQASNTAVSLIISSGPKKLSKGGRKPRRSKNSIDD
jgi:hypothetical protein